MQPGAFLANRRPRSAGAGTWAIIVRNAVSGRVLTTCHVMPNDLIVNLKQCVKDVQDVPEITLMTEDSVFLNPVQTISDAGLANGDIVLAVMMSHRLVATASSDGWVKTWDAENSNLERELCAAPPRSLMCASCSNDGHFLATGSSVGTPKFWDAKSGTLKRAFPGAHDGSVCCIDVSSDSRRIATGGYDFLGKVWDVNDGRCIREFVDPALQQDGFPPRSHLLHLLCIRFSPYDANVVATSSVDCTAKVWNVATGECLQVLRHDGKPYGPLPVTALCFASNGLDIVTTSDMFATMWNVKTGQEVRTWEVHTSTVTSVAHAVEEPLLLTGSKDGTAKVWDLQSGVCRRTLQGHDGPIAAVALSPDSKFAVTGCSDGLAKVWSTVTGTCELTLEGNKLGLLMATFVSC